MSHFELLLASVLSGQMNEAQIAAEMANPVFKAYYLQRTKGPTHGKTS